MLMPEYLVQNCLFQQLTHFGSLVTCEFGVLITNKFTRALVAQRLPIGALGFGFAGSGLLFAGSGAEAVTVGFGESLVEDPVPLPARFFHFAVRSSANFPAYKISCKIEARAEVIT